MSQSNDIAENLIGKIWRCNTLGETFWRLLKEIPFWLTMNLYLELWIAFL